MIKRIALATLLMLVASAAFAQLNMPPGKWWRKPEIIQVLNLSEEQQDRLDNIFATSANDLIDLRGEVEKQSIALRVAIDRPQLDRDAIRQAAQKLNDAQGRKFQRELMMLVDMRGVLADAQWNRMRNVLDRLSQQRQDRPFQQQEPKRPNRPKPRM
jgi:hypothetical protein